jgi:hypothetical protein
MVTLLGIMSSFGSLSSATIRGMGAFPVENSEISAIDEKTKPTAEISIGFGFNNCC